MKKLIFYSIFIVFLTSCTSKKNSPDFISKASGRYFFNADETINAYFKDEELMIGWRGKDLSPLKINDSTFYVSELNEKLIFITAEHKIKLASKREHNNEVFIFHKLKDGEKTPREYLKSGNYKMALEGYLAIKKRDSMNPVIRENNLNSIGYQFLKNDDIKKAIEVFKINIALYPNSSNTYDSMGDAYKKEKDTINAIKFYRKALDINPENRSSKRQLKRLTKREKND